MIDLVLILALTLLFWTFVSRLDRISPARRLAPSDAITKTESPIIMRGEREKSKELEPHSCSAPLQSKASIELRPDLQPIPKAPPLPSPQRTPSHSRQTSATDFKSPEPRPRLTPLSRENSVQASTPVSESPYKARIPASPSSSSLASSVEVSPRSSSPSLPSLSIDSKPTSSQSPSQSPRLSSPPSSSPRQADSATAGEDSLILAPPATDKLPLSSLIPEEKNLRHGDSIELPIVITESTELFPTPEAPLENPTIESSPLTEAEEEERRRQAEADEEAQKREIMRKYRKQAKCKWDFEGNESEDQLSFKAGDIISIIEFDKELDWWFGELNGREGYFPKAYTDIIKKELRIDRSRVSESIMAAQKHLKLDQRRGL